MLLRLRPLRLQPRLQCRGWHDVTTLSRRDCADAGSSRGLPPLLRWHARALHERPMLTAAAAGAAAAGLGDAVAQGVSWALGVHGSSELDWSARLVRCGCVASFGGLAVGCGGEVWWRALSRYFPGGTYEAGLRFTLDHGADG